MRRRALLLLTTMALVLVLASGTALAETDGGRIYHLWNGMRSVDPPPSGIEPTFIGQGYLHDDMSQSESFDISRDQETFVYAERCQGCFNTDKTGPLYTLPRDFDSFGGVPKEVEITNLWGVCDPSSGCGSQKMTQPRFSPDGETIYFIGRHILASDDTTTRAIYSVPTGGGEATKIPIEWINPDGTPRNIISFALSHDGSKFAIPGPSGIFTVPVSGGVPTRINKDSCGGAGYPSFSPDDRMIVYTSLIYSGADCTGTARGTVYTTPADNDGTRPGTPLFPEHATSTSTITSYYPTYSPDGTRIAWGLTIAGNNRLAIAPATGGNIHTLTYCSITCHPLWLAKLPNTTIWSGPSGIVSADDATFHFYSNEGGSTFECRLDSTSEDDWSECSSPQPYSGLSEGPHTFEVRATDSSGNTDPTPDRRTWTVDLPDPPPPPVIPHITDTDPNNGDTGVARTIKPMVTFDADLDPTTVNSQNVKLQIYNSRKGKWVTISSTLSYNNKAVTVIPTNILGSQKKYRVVLSTNIESSTDTNLEQYFRFTFTTRR